VATFYRGAKFLAGATVLYLALRLVHFQSSFQGDTEGIGALLEIIGTLYSVIYAFATYVIWGQFSSVESEVVKESGSLKDLVVFSAPLQASARETIVRAVKNYARAVVETEWRSLSQGDETEKTNRLFFGIVSSVTAANPEGETERLVYARLLEIANQASAHRDERLSLSVKRIPRTLLLFVTVTAFVILLLLFSFPFRSAPLGAGAIAITTALLFFAQFVLTDLDNPFEGTWNVSSQPFSVLLTKFR
jgi:hypothetical protein